jgi:hypothetical protein
LSKSSRYDLLEPDNANLSIREDTKKGVYCENLHELPVASGTRVVRCESITATINLRIFPIIMHFHPENKTKITVEY